MWYVWGRRDVHTQPWWGNMERALGKPEHRWENNIIVGLTDIG